MPSRRAFGTFALGASATLALPRIAAGQGAWPGDRPIEVIVPFPPGGGVDVMARLVLPHLQNHLGAGRFVVVNRAGAAGQLGFEAAFNAAPDGHTLGAVTAPALVSVPLERPVRYRPMEFTYLANVVDDPNTFFVPGNSPIRSLSDLVEAMRSRATELSYGTTGVGSDDHIAMLGFEAMVRAGTPLTHVPYQGAAPLLAAVTGGHVPIAVGNISEGLSLMRDNRIRSLGVAAPQRWEGTPDVPTFREQGFDLVASASRGIVGPPGLPDAIRTRLERAFEAALRDPAFLAEAQRAGLPVRPLVGAPYRAMIAEMEAGLRALWQQRPWRDA